MASIEVVEEIVAPADADSLLLDRRRSRSGRGLPRNDSRQRDRTGVVSRRLDARFELPSGVSEDAIAPALVGAYGGSLRALKKQLEGCFPVGRTRFRGTFSQWEACDVYHGARAVKHGCCAPEVNPMNRIRFASIILSFAAVLVLGGTAVAEESGDDANPCNAEESKGDEAKTEAEDKAETPPVSGDKADKE